MSRALWTTIARAFRRTAVPLAAYYAVTLALPLANGAASSGNAFAQHALVVVVVPCLAIVLACAVHTIVRAGNDRRGVDLSVRERSGRHELDKLELMAPRGH